MKVIREKFLQALNSVRAGVASKDGIAFSRSFIFYKEKVITFDDDICCRAPSGLDKSFHGAIRAAPLLALLEKLDEDEISIEQMDTEIKVKGQGKIARFALEKLEGELHVEQIEDPSEWHELPDTFGEAVTLAAQCIGVDQEKFRLTCLHFMPKWIEACDDYQSGRYRIKLTAVPEEGILSKGKPLRAIAAIGLTEMSVTDGWIHFQTKSGLVYSCRKVLDDYPDILELLSPDDSAQTATFPKGLKAAIGRAEEFSKENTDQNLIAVELNGQGKVRVRGRGYSARYSETRDMPSYKGEPTSFYISPLLFGQFIDRFNDCLICKTKILVDAGKFKYSAWLGHALKEETT
jgi:hypothetical protein